MISEKSSGQRYVSPSLVTSSSLSIGLARLCCLHFSGVRSFDHKDTVILLYITINAFVDIVWTWNCCCIQLINLTLRSCLRHVSKSLPFRSSLKLQVLKLKYHADMEALYELMTGFDTQVKYKKLVVVDLTT